MNVGPQPRDPHRNIRKHPRIPLLTPVDVRGPERFLASTGNVSLGGLFATTDRTYPPETQLWVRFNLPSGHSVSTQAVVVHSTPGKAMGLRFVGLPSLAEHVLSDFTQKVINHSRRGYRVPRRAHVTLRRLLEDESQAEMAETILVSRHGGLAIARADFVVDDRLYLWWPEKHRGAEIRVVFRHELGSGGLVELGFEFLDSENFWGMEFDDLPRGPSAA